MNSPWEGSLDGFTNASKTDSWSVKEKRAGTGNDITNHVREVRLVATDWDVWKRMKRVLIRFPKV